MKKSLSFVALALGLVLLVGSLVGGGVQLGSLNRLRDSIAAIDQAYQNYRADPYINPASDAQRQAPQEEDDALYSYRAPEGFMIKSYTRAWTAEKLEQLYYELKQNKHGKEIETLKEIIVYGEGYANWAASHQNDVMPIELSFDFGALPEDFSIDFERDISIIKLFGGDVNTTVESMARSLSHEYGHLYTFYYMFGGDMNTLGNTEYALLRQSGAYGLNASRWGSSDYADNHHRYLFEVAAEDYVQIMGSPNTRLIAFFTDIKQALEGASPSSAVEMSASGNAWPQENMMLPLASEVDGLAEYFHSFIDEAPPVPAEPKKNIDIKIDAKGITYNLVEGERTFVHYVLSWNTPYHNATYTIACYDPEGYTGYCYPIKTVRPGQAATAVVGTYTVQDGQSVTWLEDEIDTGTKIFYVVAQLPDGTYYLSNRLEYTF